MGMVIGGPVAGKEFFDRKALMSELRRDIHHAHHALIGPRGCGKSSILKQLLVEGRVNALVPIYIDVGRIVPRTHRNFIRKLGQEALRAAVNKKGLLRSMPALAKDKMGKMVDFVRDNLRVKIGDWITLYFNSDADLTEFMEQTFLTIESYGVEMLIMLDEITGLMRLSGPQPRSEDMDFLEALRGYISEAKNAHYILSGSQIGLMNLVVKMKFGRLLVPKDVVGLEEDGAEELVRAKIGREVSKEFIEGVKMRTHLWPLYLQAYCLVARIHGKKLIHLDDIEENVFDLLRMHFLYLESQLGDLELMILLQLDGGKVSDLASKLEVPYDTVLTALRSLELKGFVKKLSPGSYGSVDPMFSSWLKSGYEIQPP